MHSIRRLLIANRGEIVSRIARTARSMGIETAGIFAEPDRDLPFVRDVDTAVALPGKTPAETYLNVELVLEAAKRVGADAIHPGYGFLSENAAFAQAVLDAGLVWVGPSPEAIAAMGDKVAALERMERAGVPVLPRVVFGGESPEELLREAESVGYPLMVKAVAGGGGKGMRIVQGPDELPEAVAAARREALGAFGDPRVFAEPYIFDARHIEVQVLADQHGNTVALFERECSIQRRHQKVIEEAPSPAVSPRDRERLIEAAVAAARSIGYVNAGTIEFLWSGEGRFSFMEMNTRLQVEHPVTEMVSGVDIVREQLRIAMGLPLSFEQNDLAIRGHAIEARLYAEDPAAGFLPQTGRLLAFEVPEESGLRVDAGVASGSEISPYFDPMIAKVIAHAPTRAEAAAKLARALEHTTLFGLTTNREYLAAILRHPAFLAGDTTTRFLERHTPTPACPPADLEERALALAALIGQWERRAAAKVQRTIPSGWRNNPSQRQRTSFRMGDRTSTVEYERQRDGTFIVRVGEGNDRRAEGLRVDDGWASATIDGVLTRARWAHEASAWWLRIGGYTFRLDELPRFPSRRREEESIAGGLRAPMPGKVVAVRVTVGQRVAATDVVAILEAMKMEHRVYAGVDGIVRDVLVREGDQLNVGDLIAVVEEDGGQE
ncbi:Acetyl-/propionyl-coenzyme A carboxylase alpha chain [bacterium HR29]|jgi:propionyl-CoA carboxylase alpha chain|nr:Acetyl-/propionyl-coenzyme A carboxylase alpha chain [bacterium HR29]